MTIHVYDQVSSVTGKMSGSTTGRSSAVAMITTQINFDTKKKILTTKSSCFSFITNQLPLLFSKYRS